MITVAGVTFSMTLVTLSLASGQYTSRILRNFMRDRVTQAVLGIFTGIFIYCLVVLRTIRGGEESGFIPNLAGSVFQCRPGNRRHQRPHFFHPSHRLFDPGIEHHRLGCRRNHGGR